MKTPIPPPSLVRLSLVLLASAAPVAHGATRTWTGPTGDSWSTVGDWNGSGAVPGLSDTVRLGYASAATDDVTVNFNMSYADDSALAALTINASGLNGILTLQQSATGSQMNATAEVIGLDVTGNLYAQSGGSNTTDSLTLGKLTGGWGYYQLSGAGSLTSEHLLVGDAGTGTFTQSGGTAQPADFVMGNQAGSVANSYTQAGGTLSIGGSYAVDPWLFVGKSGQGTFNLSGGSLMLSSILYGNDWGIQFYAGGLILGLDATSTGNGFNLSGTGTISAEQGTQEMIGVNGTGIFHQTGGTNDADGLVLGAADFIADPLSGAPSSGTGIYQLDGGILSSGSGESIGANGAPGSMFYQTGGSNTAIGYGLGISAGCSYELSGGTLSTTNMSLGGLFNLTGGGSLSSSPATCALSMSGGEFRLNGHAVTVASIAGDSGTIDNGGGGNGVLTVFGGGQSYLGDLVDGDAGLLGLTKTTGGSQGLGGHNTYGNATSVLGGVLQAASDTGFSPNSSFIVNGGSLDANGHQVTIKNLSGSGGEVRFGENGSITAGDATYTSYAGAVNGPSGTFHKTGSNGFALSGGGNFGGTFDIQQGNLIVDAANGLPVASTVTIGARTTLDVWHDQALASIAGSGTLSLLATTLTIGSNSGGIVMQGGGGPSGFGGTFYGSGTIVKAQASDFTIGFGPEDTLANTESAIAFQVTGGSLILNKAAGTNAIAGPVTIAGGTLRISNNEQISDSSSVTIDDGQFSVANPIPGSAFGFSETVGNLRGAGGSIDLGDSHLTVVQTAGDEFDGSLLGNAGVFTKSGAATLAVGDVSGFNGTLQVSAGRLTLKGAAGVPKFTLAGGTFLRFDTASINLGLGGIQPGTGGTVEYLNASVSNGYLRGPGTHQILAGGSSSFSNVTTFSSTLVTQDGSADLAYFTNGGKFTNNASLALDGCTNSASGTLTVNSTVTTIDLTNDGVVVVNSGGVIDNLYGDLVAGGGSRMTVNAGGAIHLGDTGTLELDGALLVNNGTLDGTLEVNYGSLAKGSGSFGTVNLTDGGRFSPGNSPGMALISNMDFGPGGTYTFELNSAHATPGNGADFLNISGALAISAGSTANSRFTIGIASLNSAAQAAPLTDFDATKAWHFTLATAAGGISGFNPAAFAIDSSGFANPLLGGHFQVSLSGNSLMLDFVPLTTYASWAAAYELTGADALPTADPDGDGLTNLLEYAFGSNPKSADAAAGPRLCTVTSGGLRYLGLSYQRPYGPNAPQDITYAVQRSEDLANPAAWSITGLVLDSQSADALLGLETVVVRSTTPLGASPSGHEFLRLRVSQ